MNFDLVLKIILFICPLNFKNAVNVSHTAQNQVIYNLHTKDFPQLDLAQLFNMVEQNLTHASILNF